MPLRLIALLFLVGCMTTYAFWMLTASEISRRLSVESLTSTRFSGACAVALQIGTPCVVDRFARLDWEGVWWERNLRRIR